MSGLSHLRELARPLATVRRPRCRPKGGIGRGEPSIALGRLHKSRGFATRTTGCSAGGEPRSRAKEGDASFAESTGPVAGTTLATGSGYAKEKDYGHHVPVLLREVLQSFEGKALRVFVDATLGAAGHAANILQQHPELELYVGIDADPAALELARKRLQPKFGSKVELVHGNFRQYESLVSGRLRERGFQGGVDGILADLGVSSMQIDRDERGFSFMRSGPLDMRMDPDSPVSAWEVVNRYSEQELGRILRDYGEERLWKRIARSVVTVRAERSIDTTLQLAELISNTTRSARKKKAKGVKSIHPATRAFQAIRIEVNSELEAIDTALPAMIDSLNPGGTIGVISFHSLEDRRIKKTFSRCSGRVEGRGDRVSKLERYTGVRAPDEEEEEVTLRLRRRKPFVAEEEEAETNPRSRSAKYRYAEKV
ncbi:ribosomal RNA small subunit methyltransferase H [Chloropicon primus]|uniref:Ribosomal RNA small subunit methyltransferase H n=2 Tax=Chloropicon primus TaxID=1764295 RepID=A0A5B8MIG9_9CHLO|nr:ribosomal RNA small subunit methyltransferase H [Chloropicon primus]UPQ98390.1 ribosomal RNA small subunit methyltransferase H [Chloropicon primus]|eukprot:QDZ19182.1 ribosomal RNA small subunit methyltransferase H [Chloropicon primus]